MASKLLSRSISRRAIIQDNLSSRATSTRHLHIAPARRRRLCEPRQPLHLARYRNGFSTTVKQRLADVNGILDPQQQERESDVVDVCIVGGGIFPARSTRCPITNSPQDLLG